MKTKLSNQSGFTLIELILVVAIIGMLTAALAPSFGSLMANTSTVSHRGVAGNVNSALQVDYADELMIQATGGTASFSKSLTSLDSVTAGSKCSATTPCFSNIASPGITDGNWSKTATGYSFRGPGMSAAVNYTYTPGATNGSAPGYLTCVSSSGC